MIYNDKKGLRELVKRSAMRQGLTMTELAARLDWLPQELNDRFRRKDISLDTLRRICAAMDCDIDLNIILHKQG